MRRDAEGAMEPRSPGGAAEGEDNGVSGCCAPWLRFSLPGRWVRMRVHRLHLPPWDK